MKNYIELAHQTSAPVGPCRDRLLTQPELMAALYWRLLEFDCLCKELDRIKRSIFYGQTCIHTESPAPQGRVFNAATALVDDAVMELIHAGIGMATESGEFLKAVCLHLFVGDKLDKVNLGEELGDSLWYLAKAAKFTGTTLEMEMVRNISKLAARFPNKFNDAAALQRDLAKERAILESQDAPKLPPNGQKGFRDSLCEWLDKQSVTPETIGSIRAKLLLPFGCEENAIIRDETAARELRYQRTNSDIEEDDERSEKLLS